MTRRELVDALNKLLSLHEKLITSHYGIIADDTICRQDAIGRQLNEVYASIIDGASEDEEDKSYMDIHSNYDKGLLD